MAAGPQYYTGTRERVRGTEYVSSNPRFVPEYEGQRPPEAFQYLERGEYAGRVAQPLEYGERGGPYAGGFVRGDPRGSEYRSVRGTIGLPATRVARNRRETALIEFQNALARKKEQLGLTANQKWPKGAFRQAQGEVAQELLDAKYNAGAINDTQYNAAIRKRSIADRRRADPLSKLLKHTIKEIKQEFYEAGSTSARVPSNPKRRVAADQQRVQQLREFAAGAPGRKRPANAYARANSRQREIYREQRIDTRPRGYASGASQYP